MSAPLPPPRHRGPKAHRVEPACILEAAERVFAREGFPGASLRAIALEVGCDPSLLYYHFESKEALLLALLDKVLPPLHQELSTLASDRQRPVVERLWEVLRLFHRFMGGHAGLRAVVRGELVRGVEGLATPLHQRVLRQAEQVRTILRQGHETGELRQDLDPRLASFFLVRMFIETMDLIPRLCALGEADRAPDLPSAARAWYQLYWRGVAADPLQPLPDLPEL